MLCTLLKRAALWFGLRWRRWGRRLLGAAARWQKLPDHPLHLWPEDMVDLGIHYLGHDPVHSLFQHPRPERYSLIEHCIPCSLNMWSDTKMGMNTCWWLATSSSWVEGQIWSPGTGPFSLTGAQVVWCCSSAGSCSNEGSMCGWRDDLRQSCPLVAWGLGKLAVRQKAKQQTNLWRGCTSTFVEYLAGLTQLKPRLNFSWTYVLTLYQSVSVGGFS